MASVLVSNPYTSQPSVTSAYSHSPQPPPSPPVEDPNSKCTLPSIQSLIGMADSSPSTPIPSGAEWETQQIQHQSPVVGNEQGQEFRPYGYGQPGVSNPTHLPPTPPLRPNSGFDGSHQSPSTSSRSSYAGNAINNVEPHSQRQPQPSAIEPYPVARLPSQSPYANSPFVNSPSGASTYSYPSPANHPPTSGGLYYPRPLPAAYPPPELPVTLSNSHHSSPIDPTNTWQHQHHHYISPSSSAAFAGQSQDRYISILILEKSPLNASMKGVEKLSV
ncbi:hypothetical protein MMC14_001196 [Varicellaria rhodocarpa]|nr:hypothetical protein [Varicellaria rhodocarpa]